MPTRSKQPGERFEIDHNFEDVLNATELITAEASSASAVNNQGESPTVNVLVDDSLTVVGTKIYITLASGAEDESPYKVSILAGTDEGNIYEYDIYIVVEEL